MDIEIVRRVCLARHLYELAERSLKSSNELYLFSAANLLQDAVEVFLLAVCDAVAAPKSDRDTFDKYFVNINAKIEPRELPFKTQLLRLNRIRVDSKHYGIQPDRQEVTRLAVSVREFFKEVSDAILEANFSTLSILDLLNDGGTKEILLHARAALDAGDLEECAISCRKAIYMEIEHQYSIYPFREGHKHRGLLGPTSSAPYFTRNSDYIDKYVRTPTDYVQLDHAHVDRELTRYGVDNTSFWNVWRLTPSVFRDDDGKWAVERDFQKLDKAALEDNIQYIFDTTTNIVFSIHSVKNTVKMSSTKHFNYPLAKEETPIYEKADRHSKVVGVTPKGATHIDCSYYIEGLQGDGYYCNVFYLAQGIFLYGFIHNDDLVASEKSDDAVTGRVKWFDQNRGFGFVIGDDGADAFVHKSNVGSKDLANLREDVPVKYKIEPADKGPVAVDLRIVGE